MVLATGHYKRKKKQILFVMKSDVKKEYIYILVYTLFIIVISVKIFF